MEKKTRVLTEEGEEKGNNQVRRTHFIKAIKQKGKSMEQIKPSISIELKKHYCLVIRARQSEPQRITDEKTAENKIRSNSY